MTRTQTAPAHTWKQLILLPLLGTAGCLALSLGLNYLLLFSDALTPFGRSVVTAAEGNDAPATDHVN